MTRSLTVGLVAMLLALAGCAATGEYPMGGGQCGPNDPVQKLDVKDCVVPGS